ncbi:hypothetical protein BV25DRAFT_1815066, partial [Artomyces pyxidatus]
LLTSRQKSCLSRPALNRHVEEGGILSVLKRQDMSADETDPENPTGKKAPKTFRSIPLEWRSPAFVAFLHKLDDIYRDNWRHPTDKRATSGNPPRHRVHPNINFQEGIPHSGLPRNCYHPEFLASLRPWQLRNLDIIDEDYDFAIPDDEL